VKQQSKSKKEIQTAKSTHESAGQRIAIYPGSFDPVTLGHIDVIKRLSLVFDVLYVVVSDSSRKTYLFNRDERQKMIIDSVKSFKNVKVVASSNLTIDTAKKLGAKIIARSVRTVGDWEYEYAMAYANKKLAPDIETFFIMANPELGFISSSLVREVAQFGGDASLFVPSHVSKALKNKQVKK
jgi:pantetheine-phosphate adenylyltransferase